MALIAGWITTEVGRQPWIVYEVMKTDRGGHRSRGDPDRLRDPGGRLSRPRLASSSGSCAASPASRSSASCPAEAEAAADGSSTSPLAVLVLGARHVLGPRRRRLRRRLLGPDRGRRRARGARVRGMLKRSMSPVWEANHVWLIFVLVVFWTGFPKRLRAGDGDAVRAAVRRRGRDHPPRHRLRPARRGGDDRRGAGARARPSRSPRCWCRSSSGRRSARSPAGQVSVPADPDSPFASWTELDLALHRRARGRDRRLPGGRLRRRRRGPGRAARHGRGVPQAGARRRRWSPARWRSAASSSSATTPATSTTGSPPGVGLVVVIGSAIAGLITIALVWTRRFALARFTFGDGGRRDHGRADASPSARLPARRS